MLKHAQCYSEGAAKTYSMKSKEIFRLVRTCTRLPHLCALFCHHCVPPTLCTPSLSLYLSVLSHSPSFACSFPTPFSSSLLQSMYPFHQCHPNIDFLPLSSSSPPPPTISLPLSPSSLALQDAMQVVRNVVFDPRMLPGGGATELAISHAISKSVNDIEGDTSPLRRPEACSFSPSLSN